MASVGLPAAEAARALEGHEGRLCVAAINDPGSVVLSGEARALAELVARLSQQGVACRRLDVAYAFHAPFMAPSESDLVAAIGPIERRRAALPFYSAVTGARLAGAELDAAYWARNVRQPVQFARAVEAAIADQHRAFLEVAPRPVLSGSLEQCLAAAGVEGSAVPTLRRDKDGLSCLMQSIAALYACGCAVDFRRLYPEGGRVVSLPTYPWQRQRYWLSSAPGRRGGRPSASTDGGDGGVAPGDAASLGDAGDVPAEAAVHADAAAARGVDAAAWLARLRALPPEARAAEVEAAVRADVAAALLLPEAAEIPADCPLRELGMDSLMAVNLRHELSARTGQPVPSTLAFDYPTVQEIARYVLDDLLPEGRGAPGDDTAASGADGDVR
ncbi:uncharacterized protein SOCE26_093380 [Sorangium cellulosum]|uniref:Carrier domain-containing protein n=1 Tax=Sorangium cellulosum TaxID=56 RepID=A0A2L0F893_SORCE|nr:uncharacterized protein SOCE26_093380 [Sorangium cellulosum]